MSYLCTPDGTKTKLEPGDHMTLTEDGKYLQVKFVRPVDGGTPIILRFILGDDKILVLGNSPASVAILVGAVTGLAFRKERSRNPKRTCFSFYQKQT